MTPTIEAILDISAGAFEEIKERFRGVGANLDSELDGRQLIVLGTFAFRREESNADIRAYLVYQGKVLPKGAKDERTTGTDSDSDGDGVLDLDASALAAGANEAAGEVPGPIAQDEHPPVTR